MNAIVLRVGTSAVNRAAMHFRSTIFQVGVQTNGPVTALSVISLDALNADDGEDEQVAESKEERPRNEEHENQDRLKATAANATVVPVLVLKAQPNRQLIRSLEAESRLNRG